MNTLEMELHYPFGDTLAPSGGALEVAPGIRWVRMALPFALNHINLWLLRDSLDGVEGWTIVDCCIDRDEAREQWESIFVNALDGLPVLRVIATHMHPDHIGLAHWLCERWQVRLWISATDYHVARLACLAPSVSAGNRAADFFASHGLGDPDILTQIKARAGYFPSLVPQVPNQYRRIIDGMGITIGANTWSCISGYGHAPEHIALYCESLNVLIGGDMMLPRISTNVSVYEQEPEANALALFLDSIDKFRSLPTGVLVLPSHGKPFTGLHERVNQLHDHHRDRLREVLAACDPVACSAADILPVLFKREMDMHQTTFALGESIAHLHALWYQGKLSRTKDADGVFRFRAVAVA